MRLSAADLRFCCADELSVNNCIYSLNIYKFSEILEILLQT